MPVTSSTTGSTTSATTSRSPGSFHMVEAVVERLDGSPVGGRRRWSDEFKARVVAASLEPDINISALARRFDLLPSQLYVWRKTLLAKHPDLMPMPAPVPPSRPATADIGRVELMIGDATIRVGTEIGEAALARILRAVRAT